MTTFEFNGKTCVGSRYVAELLGRKHCDLLRTITAALKAPSSESYRSEFLETKYKCLIGLGKVRSFRALNITARGAEFLMCALHGDPARLADVKRQIEAAFGAERG